MSVGSSFARTAQCLAQAAGDIPKPDDQPFPAQPSVVSLQVQTDGQLLFRLIDFVCQARLRVAGRRIHELIFSVHTLYIRDTSADPGSFEM